MWWSRKEKKIPHLGLMLVADKIATKLDMLLSIKFHAMFADANHNLEKAISAIDFHKYEDLKTLNDVKWDGDFLFLVSCEFPFEKIVFIFRQPYEYLFDNSSFLYERIITIDEYKDLCERQEPFSNYLFNEGKLIKAFASDGEDLFKMYDFSKLTS